MSGRCCRSQDHRIQPYLWRLIVMRECKTCLRALPLTAEYFEKNNTKAGFRPVCKECSSAVRREQYKDRYYPGKYADVSKHSYKSAKGWIYLTNDQRATMFESSSKRCEICFEALNSPFSGERSTRGQLDHCHETGRFRGWLCTQCNVGIGSFKDNVRLLQRAIEYLKSNSELEVPK